VKRLQTCSPPHHALFVARLFVFIPFRRAFLSLQPAMLGHTHSSYRQRRSFKKYYYTVFAILTFFLFRSVAFSKAREVAVEDTVQRNTPHGLETLPGARDEQPIRPRVADGSGHHAHPQLNKVGDIDNRYAPRMPLAAPDVNDPANQQKDSAKIAGLSHNQQDTEEHDIDDIDTIRGHSADSVEQSAKLTHPDDDVEADGEHADFGSDEQVRLGQSEKVEELLKADHPSKQTHAESADVDTETDDVVTETADDAMKFPIQPLKHMTPWSEDYTFPSWDECQTVKEKADNLPDMIHVPFEQAVEDVLLEGWEDEWIAKARYAGPKLQEPRIDFVYNCMRFLSTLFIASTNPYHRGQWLSAGTSNSHAPL
jgi:hypothetical protein